MPEDGETRRQQTPLLGFVLCCTSIAPEQRGQMAAVAQQMGAVHKLDLTSDVTHLLVGNIDTPKYKYVARERPDIRVLDPAWLDAVRDSWMEGGDTDVEDLTKQYELPALYNLQICITGFDDVQLRTFLADSISARGAKYHGDLTRQVTHLIAAAPHGKKYEYAGSWGIRIVSVKWLEDSLARGMVLDESKYHPTIALEQQGVGALAASMPKDLGKRPLEDDGEDAPVDHSKRKIRRTMSAKLGVHNDELWNDIGSAERTGDRKSAKNMNETESRTSKAAIAVEESFAPLEPPRNHARNNNPELLPGNGALNNGRLRSEGLFAGNGRPHACFIEHFDARKTAILRTHLESNGAQLLSRAELKYLYDSKPSETDREITVVVPHDISSDDYDDLESKGFWPTYASIVSDWWIEKCLYDKVVEDKNLPRFRPLKDLPIQGFPDLTICPTSFSGIDLLHFSKAVKLSGATYNEWLKPATSILVSDSKKPNADKVQFAVKQGIPVVLSGWFWACVEAGRKVPFEDYLVVAPAMTHPSQQDRSARSQTPSSDAEGRRTSARSFQEMRRKQQGQLETKSSGAENAGKRSASQVHEKKSARHKSSAIRTGTPLQELSQRHNSQESGKMLSFSHEEGSGHHIDEEHDSGFAAPEQPEGATARIDDTRDKENTASSNRALNTAIAQLLAQKKTTSAEKQSASILTEDGNPNPLSRRHRPLGRASSNPSSLGPSVLSRTSTERYPSSLAATQEGLDEGCDDERRSKSEQQPLSQTLTYEDPETLAARERLMKRIGNGDLSTLGRLGTTGMTRVESVGTMKETPAGADERTARRTGRKR